MPTADDFDIAKCAATKFGKPAGKQLRRQFAAKTWARECFDAGMDMRIAAILLGKTKAELIEVLHNSGEDNFYELMERLGDRHQRFSDLADVLKTVMGRLIVAGSAVVVEQRAA